MNEFDRMGGIDAQPNVTAKELAEKMGRWAGVRDTSAESHAINEQTINKTLKQKIVDLVAERGPVTRRQIAKILKVETATVSGLVTPLLKATKDKPAVFTELDKQPCPITNRPAYRVMVAPKQEEMF